MNISTEGPHQVDFLVPFNNAAPVEGVAQLMSFPVLFDGTFLFLSLRGPNIVWLH
jgi:hypothetical protein